MRSVTSYRSARRNVLRGLRRAQPKPVYRYRGYEIALAIAPELACEPQLAAAMRRRLRNEHRLATWTGVR